jgi:hypothetical protein
MNLVVAGTIALQYCGSCGLDGLLLLLNDKLDVTAPDVAAFSLRGRLRRCVVCWVLSVMCNILGIGAFEMLEECRPASDYGEV